MTKIGLMRCAQNSQACPLTSCFKALRECAQGFAMHEDAELVGVFTLTEDPEQNVNLAKILKAKGADVIHMATCAFARKQEGKWIKGHGFCPDPDGTLSRMAREAGILCIKGSAHLPEDYKPVSFA